MTDTPRRGIVARILIGLFGPPTRHNVLSWAVVVIAILTIRWLLFEPFHVPSGSMEPTLHGNYDFLRDDRVGVNKLAYGPRIPFTTHRLFHLDRPQRWDIVVFTSVEENPQHKRLIKRIVGLPGERIHIADGRILVNGQPVEPPEDLRGVLHYTDHLNRDRTTLRRFVLQMAQFGYQSPMLNPQNPTARGFREDLEAIKAELGDRAPETLPEPEADRLFGLLRPVSLQIADQLLAMEQDRQYPLLYGIREEDEFSLIPEGHYLMLGDNSLDSVDGRVYGWVPDGHILGRAFCIGWPVPRWRDFTGFSRTWWGAALLYGIPAITAGYILWSFIRGRRTDQANKA